MLNWIGARMIATENSTMSRISVNRPNERSSQLPKKTTSTGRTYQWTAVRTSEKTSSGTSSPASAWTLLESWPPRMSTAKIRPITAITSRAISRETKSTTDWNRYWRMDCHTECGQPPAQRLLNPCAA